MRSILIPEFVMVQPTVRATPKAKSRIAFVDAIMQTPSERIKEGRVRRRRACIRVAAASPGRFVVHVLNPAERRAVRLPALPWSPYKCVSKCRSNNGSALTQSKLSRKRHLAASNKIRMRMAAASNGAPLVVFDFDKTIVDCDSDNWVVDALGATRRFDEFLRHLPWNHAIVSAGGRALLWQPAGCSAHLFRLPQPLVNRS